MSQPSDLVPHRPPWIVLDRVVSVESGSVVAEKRVAAAEPLVGEAGLSPLLVVELAAQAAACVAGAELAAAGREHHGYLVAASGWKFPAVARAGDTIRIAVRRAAALGALSRFSCIATVDERVIAEGELTCALA